MAIPADSDTDHILVCDIEYPGLHDIHDAYPVCPENIVIGEKDVSPYTKELTAECGITLRPGQTTVPDVEINDKLCYPLQDLTVLSPPRLSSEANLQSCSDSPCGCMVLCCIRQKRDAVPLMTLTACCIKSVECNVFGKTIENDKQRVNVRIVTSPKTLRRLVSKH